MPLIEARGLAKRYGGVDALRDVDFAAEAGEVHAIVGANGAGKSTLMGVLSGVVRPTAGVLRVDGRDTRLDGPADALAAGIATVYQELSLVPQLTVAENIHLGHEGAGRLGRIDRRAMAARTSALLERHGLPLDPGAPVGALGVAQQQLVEIARALSRSASVLILDEPTAAMTPEEQRRLFAIVRGLRRDGLLVLFVSHRLDEVLAISDRISVMRDGRMIATRAAAEVDEAALVRAMVGRDLDAAGAAAASTPPPRPDGPPIVEAGWRTGGAENGRASRLVLHPGEIVGLAGFVGSGRTALGRAIAGLGGLPLDRLVVDGRPLARATAAAALRAGIVYVTEDRKRDGLFLNLPVVANASAAILGRLGRLGILDRGAERRAAATMLERLRLVCRSLAQPVEELSGGNQQKVLFGRALLAAPRLLICDEPTRGVDVAAKAEIHRLIAGLAADGLAVLVISSEIEELLGLCPRLAVMRDGAILCELAGADATAEAVALAASGGTVPAEERRERP